MVDQDRRKRMVVWIDNKKWNRRQELQKDMPKSDTSPQIDDQTSEVASKCWLPMESKPLEKVYFLILTVAIPALEETLSSSLLLWLNLVIFDILKTRQNIYA
jgi:hypothetical protein